MNIQTVITTLVIGFNLKNHYYSVIVNIGNCFWSSPKSAFFFLYFLFFFFMQSFWPIFVELSQFFSFATFVQFLLKILFEKFNFTRIYNSLSDYRIGKNIFFRKIDQPVKVYTKTRFLKAVVKIIQRFSWKWVESFQQFRV